MMNIQGQLQIFGYFLLVLSGRQKEQRSRPRGIRNRGKGDRQVKEVVQRITRIVDLLTGSQQCVLAGEVMGR
jgi:hypothetical protein